MANREEESWVVDIRNKLKEVDTSVELEVWQKQSIYRVPRFFKVRFPNACKPHMVSFGPYHHGDPDLLPMEEHKHRALLHFLKRAARPFEDFLDGIKEIVQQLQDSYQNLGDEWSNRDRFLRLMIVDGCFMLEVIHVATGRDSDYASDDPIFSTRGMSYTVPNIKRDMFKIENQLPLLVLKTLVAIESGESPNDDQINRMVLKLWAPSAQPPTPGIGLGLHPLDLFRSSLLQGPPVRSTISRAEPTWSEIVPSAVKLYEAGISLRRSKSNSLRDISFCDGVLTLPGIVVDDATQSTFANLMAFERLHVRLVNEITSYVFFMNNIINSDKDASLLSSEGIIQNSSCYDEYVTIIFVGLSADVMMDIQSSLHEVHRKVNDYRRSKWSMYNMWLENLKRI